MARIPRVHIEGALFYVTSRGDNNADIFREDSDYNAYLELLNKYKAQYGFKLFAFCLLANHLHLLIELKEGITVSDIMHDLNTNYTKYFNGKYERKGHLFQERYKMVIVEKEHYMLKVAAYIHLNPVIVGLVENLKDYTYSSCQLSSGRRGAGPAMDEEIRELRAKDYPDFLTNIKRQEMEAFGKELTKNTILGSAEFVERVRKQASEMEAAEAKKTGEGHRRLVYVSLAGAVVLAVFTFYLYGKTAVMRKKYRDEMARKNQELRDRMAEERKKVVKDLEEKYSADRVSYDAMAKRLELEKKKAKELEEKARGGGRK